MVKYLLGAVITSSVVKGTESIGYEGDPACWVEIGVYSRSKHLTIVSSNKDAKVYWEQHMGCRICPLLLSLSRGMNIS
jgi:hypothetical protein